MEYLDKETLKKRVAERIAKQGTIRYVYYQDGKYCAIGHLLSEAGMSDQELAMLPFRVGYILEIGDGENWDVAYNVGRKARDILRHYGFTRRDLERIQFVNDWATDNREAKLVALISSL